MSAVRSIIPLKAAEVAADIEQALLLLHSGTDLPFEIRSPKFPPRGQTASGYYTEDTITQCAQDVARLLDPTAQGTYVTLNPVKEHLLARCANRLDLRAAHTTGDQDIAMRRWLPVDLDAVPASGISASEAEHSAALARAREMVAILSSRYGWPAPILADSGNGGHGLWRVDLPAADGGLVARALQGLDTLFSDPEGAAIRVHVDTSTGNAARIFKLYGTMARKGDDTPQRPHRRSRLLDVPDTLDVLTLPQLEMLVTLAPAPEARQPNTLDHASGRGHIADLGAWIEAHGIQVHRTKREYGATIYELEHCPWNPDHGPRKAWALQRDSGGALAAGCQHAGCREKTWRDLRAVYEPEASAAPHQRPYEVRGTSRGQPTTINNTSQPTQAAPRPAQHATAPQDVEAKDVEATWEEPTPLPSDLPPVQAFDLGMLPDGIRAWVGDIAERQQSPVDFVAVAAIVVAASLVGRRVGIHPKRQDDWPVVPNLYGALVGGPSAMKSPTAGEVMKVVKWLEALANEEHARQAQEYEAQESANGIRRKALKDAAGDAAKTAAKAKGKTAEDAAADLDRLTRELAQLPADEEPHPRRYYVNDATVEKLGEILLHNPQGVLVYRDELSGWLSTLDKQGRESDRAFYLEAWKGTEAPFTVDRIARGSISIPALCISILGGIQPGPLARYVLDAQTADSAGNDGLLQRFQLLVWPDVAREYHHVDRWPNKEAKDQAYGLYRRLANLTPEECGASLPAADDPTALPMLRFDDEAQGIFDEWYIALQTRLRGGDLPPALEAHLGKYASLMPSLALLFHLMGVVSGTAQLGPVGTEAALQAIAWCEYLESHAARVYGSAINAAAERAKALLRRIQRGDVDDGVSVRDLYHRHWANLSGPQEMGEAARYLADFGWVREADVETGGRPSTVLRIHPTLRKTPPNASPQDVPEVPKGGTVGDMALLAPAHLAHLGVNDGGSEDDEVLRL